MIREEEVYKIGRLGKPHGVKGELQMQFADDVFDRVEADYLVLRIEGILVPFFLEEYRFKSDETALVKFCDIDTQEQAARLTGTEVLFPRALADEDSDNASLAELIGYHVIVGESGEEGGEDFLEERGERREEREYSQDSDELEGSDKSISLSSLLSPLSSENSSPLSSKESSKTKDLGTIASIDDSTANVLIELEDGTLIPIHPDWVEHIDKSEKRLYMNIPDGLIG